MKSCIVSTYIAKMQNDMYFSVNKFSREDKCQKFFGRLSSIPVSVLDVALETIKTPLQIIECLAFAVINAFGALYSSRCNLKDALLNTEGMFSRVACLPVVAALASLKIIYQLFAIAFEPTTIGSINYYPNAGYVRNVIY